MKRITEKAGQQTTAGGSSGANDPTAIDNTDNWARDIRKRGWSKIKERHYQVRSKTAPVAGERTLPSVDAANVLAAARETRCKPLASIRDKLEKRKAKIASGQKIQTAVPDKTDDEVADEETTINGEPRDVDPGTESMLSEDDDGAERDGGGDWLLRTFALFRAMEIACTPPAEEAEEAACVEVREVVEEAKECGASKAPKPVPAPFVESRPQPPRVRSKNAYPVPSFGAFGSAIQSVAKVTQVEPSMVGLALLGGLSPLGQPLINVSHRSRDKGMPVTVNVLCVAESGERKSSVLRTIVDPIMRGLQEAGDCRTGMITSDMTIDGLLKGLIQRCPSQYILAPEAVTVLGGHALTEEAKGRFFGALSGLYSDEPLSRTRADEHIFAANRRLAVTLFGQPVVVREFLSSPLVMQQGTANRFLFDWPQSLRGTRYYNDDELDGDPAYRMLAKRLQALASTPWDICEQTGGIDPRVVRLSSQAKPLWVDFYNHLESHIGAGGRYEDYAGYVSRFPEQVLRIAALLALLDDTEVGQIDVDVMERALALGHYYLRSALRLFMKMGAEN